MGKMWPDGIDTHITRSGTKEQNEQFAAALALLLPDPTYHTGRPEENITPGVLENARNGMYWDTFAPGMKYPPYAFVAPEYWQHLRPIIEEIWRAIYAPSNPAG